MASYSGLACVNNPIQFYANAQGATNHQWNFNNEGTNNTTSTPKFIFNTTGFKTVTYSCKLANGNICTSTVTLTVKPKPQVRIQLLNDSIQCFEGNMFCFKDSSLSGDGNYCIKSIKYLFSDNELITKFGTKFNPVKMPVTFCKTFFDLGGSVNSLTIEIEDCNGCITKVVYPQLLKTQFSPNIQPSFKLTGDPCKGYGTAFFKNDTTIKLSSLKSFKWIFDDGTFDSLNWDSVSHTYNVGNDIKKVFNPKLEIITKIGCKKIISLDMIELNNISPYIKLSRDSICIGDSVNYKVYPTNIKDIIEKNNITWYLRPGLEKGIYSGTTRYAALGPKLITCTISHPCGPYILNDTLIVIGPQSIIEPEFIKFNERYQCTITDTVNVSDKSIFYHNDPYLLDDDSVFRKNAGNLGHHFTNGFSTKAKLQIRNGNNVSRLWDFGDNYCEPCTTDFKNNKNTWLNCNYSKDSMSKHWYTPWDSIYKYQYSTQFFYKNGFDFKTKTCTKTKIFIADTLYVVTDTMLYYGDNGLGSKSKDSTIFNGLRKTKIPSGIIGKGELYSPYNMWLYVPALDTVYIDKHNGLGLVTLIGPTKYLVNKRHTIIVKSNTDKCLFQYALQINKDTLTANALLGYHKIIKKIKHPQVGLLDSVNAVLHRQLFYQNIPACYTIQLNEKDTIHDLKCENAATTQVALTPPSAKGLYIDNHYCYGYNNKILELKLSETKPGCTQSFAMVNFDYKNTPDKWELINDSLGGEVKRGSFLNTNAPYSGYKNEGAYSGKFYNVYNDTDLQNTNIQNLNVAIIIGNGYGPNNFCVDTVYYPNFAQFPKLTANLEIIGSKKNETPYVCPKTIVYATIPVIESNSNRLASSSSWLLYDLAKGDTTEMVIEEYYKIKNHYKFPNKKINYTIVKRFKNSNGNVIEIKKDTIFTAIVHQYKEVLLMGARNNKLREKLAEIGLSINDYDDTTITALIWNGVGTIGNPLSGSKGCADTTGFGSNLVFDIAVLSSTILNYKDTSLLPIDSVNNNNIKYRGYGFYVPKNGAFRIERNVESMFPTYCPLMKSVNLIAGFKSEVILGDSIVCKGNTVDISTKFNYYDIRKPYFGSLDSTNYWKIREQQAGAKGFEAQTKWDFSKADDDKNNLATIFGSMPYTRIGLGNPTISLGREQGGIYYRNAGYYLLRMAAGDSLGCTDTFSQNIYVMGPKAGFFIDLTRPNCKAIIELFDTSKLIDPCVIKGLPPCDNIVNWTIRWGDGSADASFNKQLPKQIGHDYKKNGKFRIWLVIFTALGCKDSTYQDIEIPGPTPNFTVYERRTICVNDSITFHNKSNSKTPSAQWLWNFGDGIFEPQFDTGFITHQYTKTGVFDVYLTQNDSIKNSGIYCSETFPDTLHKISITVLPYDKYQLQAIPQIVCVGDTVKIIAQITSTNKYKNYQWQLEKQTIEITNSLEKKYRLNRFGKFTIYFKADTNGLNQLACPSMDSINVYTDSVIANFEIDESKAPIYCFNNTSQYAVKYRWGFFHDKDIVKFKLPFNENEQQLEPERKICQAFFDHPGENWICLEAINALGCKDTICKKIINNYERAILPPNVFTPGAKDGFKGQDKDGLEGNNYFNIYLKGEEFYHLRIYDRWGVKVFESTDKTIDWAGKVNNSSIDCPDGTYYYILDYRYKGKDKNEPILNGVIQLIRER